MAQTISGGSNNIWPFAGRSYGESSGPLFKGADGNYYLCFLDTKGAAADELVVYKSADPTRENFTAFANTSTQVLAHNPNPSTEYPICTTIADPGNSDYHYIVILTRDGLYTAQVSAYRLTLSTGALATPTAAVFNGTSGSSFVNSNDNISVAITTSALYIFHSAAAERVMGNDYPRCKYTKLALSTWTTNTPASAEIATTSQAGLQSYFYPGACLLAGTYLCFMHSVTNTLNVSTRNTASADAVVQDRTSTGTTCGADYFAANDTQQSAVYIDNSNIFIFQGNQALNSGWTRFSISAGSLSLTTHDHTGLTLQSSSVSFHGIVAHWSNRLCHVGFNETSNVIVWRYWTGSAWSNTTRENWVFTTKSPLNNHGSLATANLMLINNTPTIAWVSYGTSAPQTSMTFDWVAMTSPPASLAPTFPTRRIFLH